MSAPLAQPATSVPPDLAEHRGALVIVMDSALAHGPLAQLDIVAAAGAGADTTTPLVEAGIAAAWLHVSGQAAAIAMEEAPSYVPLDVARAQWAWAVRVATTAEPGCATAALAAIASTAGGTSMPISSALAHHLHAWKTAAQRSSAAALMLSLAVEALVGAAGDTPAALAAAHALADEGGREGASAPALEVSVAVRAALERWPPWHRDPTGHARHVQQAADALLALPPTDLLGAVQVNRRRGARLHAWRGDQARWPLTVGQ